MLDKRKNVVYNKLIIELIYKYYVVFFKAHNFLLDATIGGRTEKI